jgi:hypothetical protein
MCFPESFNTVPLDSGSDSRSGNSLAGARTKPGGRPCLGQDGGEVDGHLIAQRVLAQRQLRQAAERAQVTMMLARGRFSIDWNKGKTSIHRQDKQSALSGKQVPVSRR